MTPEQLKNQAAIAVLQGIYAGNLAEGYAYETLAKWAWDQADALVKARPRQPEEAVKPTVVPPHEVA